jgi:enoyl-CoA hydratase/carnithine racemase
MMSATSRYASYQTLDVDVANRVVTAAVRNPPMNMLTKSLVTDLDRFTSDVADDPDPLVLVLKSQDPEIFMTHNEFSNLYAMQPAAIPASVEQVGLNAMHVICERLRTMDKVTIAQVEGRATGGAAAMAMACDMRFGSRCLQYDVRCGGIGAWRRRIPIPPATRRPRPCNGTCPRRARPRR